MVRYHGLSIENAIMCLNGKTRLFMKTPVVLRNNLALWHNYFLKLKGYKTNFRGYFPMKLLLLPQALLSSN